MFKAYLFIKNKRLRKKINLYKVFLSITLDATSIFYVTVLLGYSLFAFIQIGEAPAFIQETLNFISNVLVDYHLLLSVVVFLPVYFIVQSFQRPGIIFSSAEFLLSILPHKRSQLWMLSLIEKIMKLFLIISFVAAIIYIVTPIPLSTIIIYIFILLIIVTGMTIIQWKLFQVHIWWRVMVIIFLGLMAGMYSISENKFVLAMYLIILITLFYVSLRNLFTAVDWKRVIASSDFLIWNMRFISQATKIKFKKDAQPSLWYRLKDWKKKFPYEKDFAYHRLWYIYVEKQIGMILQVTGALFLLLSVGSYFREFYFVMIIAVAIHIQTNLLVSIFKDRLNTDIVTLLPWDIRRFHQTFIGWAILISVLLLAPAGIYAVYHFGGLFIIYLLFICGAFYNLLHIKLRKYAHELDKRHDYSSTSETIGYFLLLILIISAIYPYLLIIGYLILIIALKKIIAESE